MIRRLFSNYPFFYKVYFYFYRKHKGIQPSWFTKNTDLYMDGYPRSGNTFLKHLVVNIFPKLNTVDHLHKVAPIKIALRRKLPVIILIRDPEECIPSNYLKHYAPNGSIPTNSNLTLLDRLTNDYYYYYYYVRTNINKIHLIKFEKLIDDSIATIELFSNLSNINSINFHSLESKVDEASETYRGATTKYGSSKPNIHKEREKNKLKEKLPQMNRYKEAKELYNQLFEVAG